jgi:hypothetical protein
MNITTSGDAIDYLTYVSYVTQRRLSPDVEPSRLGSIFHDWTRLEDRYQVSIAAHARVTNVLQS